MPSAAIVASSAASSLPMMSASPRVTYMPAVRRSRVAEGSIRSFATSWPSRSDGTTYGRPSGNRMRRSHHAATRLG